MRNMRAALAALGGKGISPMAEGGGPWGGGGGGKSGGGGDSGGGGPRNPWNQPPEGDKPRGPRGPSAFDELLKRAKGAGSRFPEGDGRSIGRWVAYGVLAMLVLWVVTTSIHQIEPAERGVVTRLGRYSHTLEPGVSFTLPAPIDAVQVIDTQNVRTTDIPNGGERLVLTGDQNLIDLEYTVRWTIRDPEQYFFQAVDPDGTIRSVGESTMRAALANMTFNEAVGTGRNVLEAEVAQRMQAILDSYRLGVRVQGIAIKQTDPPEAVVDAFKEVSAAQQNAVTSVNQAKAYAQQILQRAQGDAGAFDRVYVQYKAAPEVTRRRMYYETMERVLSKVDKTVVEAPGVTPYLPLRELKRAPAPGAGQ
jgi:modulator of FtsH protease HflK